MEPRGGARQVESGGAALAARLRRINVVAAVAAVLWIAVAAACTVWTSERILSGYLAEAATSVEHDARAMAGIVDRVFQELESIAQVLSSSRELRVVVARYNALGSEFFDLPQEERRSRLRNDPAVVRANERLTLVRDALNYDLLYVLNVRGIRIVTSDWDRPVSLLGEQLDDREYFQEAMKERVGRMFAVGRTTKMPTLFFSVRLEEEAGVIGPVGIGVVVVRQDSETLGSLLEADGRRTTLVVDAAGMVVAASRPGFALRHVGALADKRPDADSLRDVYAQEALRTLDIVRPPRPTNDAEWAIEGRSYLVNKTALKAVDFHLLTLSPIDWVETVRPTHYVIGGLIALFGVLVVLLVARGATSLARRLHDEQVTAALNEKLKALNVEKDRYLGIAAHDLRNPLSSMRGLSELMLEAPLEPEQQREFLETIHRTSDEMLGLVNDLLDVSVIESGKLELRRSDQDIATLVQRRIRHLEAHARSKKIELKLDVDGAQRASIDAARFGQVIDNLVSNAIKFSPSGTAVQVALRSGEGSFTLSVQDQGPGIPEEERKLLFRSFQKLSARPTGGEKSTGLGLAIVKKIVDAHGGTIDVENALGGGTRFTVNTPSTPAGD